MENDKRPNLEDYFEQKYAIATISGVKRMAWDPMKDLIALELSTPKKPVVLAVTQKGAEELIYALQTLLENRPDWTEQ